MAKIVPLCSAVTSLQFGGHTIGLRGGGSGFLSVMAGAIVRVVEYLYTEGR
jgi:hypothetical protein